MEKIMLEILNQVESNANRKEVLARLGHEDFNNALEECIQLGYLNGLHAVRAVSERLNIDVIGDLTVTKTGKAFISLHKDR